MPRLAIHHPPSANVHLACSRDTVRTFRRPSSTAPRPARAPEVRVCATESPVTSRSQGTGARTSSATVARLATPWGDTGSAQVLPSWATKTPSGLTCAGGGPWRGEPRGGGGKAETGGAARGGGGTASTPQ